MQGTIVVAERSETVRRMVEIALDRQPFKLKFVTNGEEALKAIREHSPQIAIADAALSGIDGYELTQRVKEDTLSSGVKMILLVGRNSQFQSARAREVGVDAHTTKPFITQKLIELIFKAMGREAPDAHIFRSTTLNIPLARKSRALSTPSALGSLNLMGPPRRSSTPPRSVPPSSGPLSMPSITGSIPAPSLSGPPLAPPPVSAPPLSLPPVAPRSAPPLPVLSVPAASAPPALFSPASPPDLQASSQTAAQAITRELSGHLEGSSKEIIERIAWEVIPKLAETLLKEEIARLVRERLAAS